MQKKQFPSVLASWAKQSEELVYRKMMKANDGLLVEKWNEFYKHLIIEDRVFDVNSKKINSFEFAYKLSRSEWTDTY